MQIHGEEKTTTALKDARQAWVQTPRKNGGGTYSVLNGAWVEWAIASLAGETPWQSNQPKTALELIEEDFAARR